MLRMLAVCLMTLGCAAPAQEAPPAKTPASPEVDRLNRVDTDVARVKEISQLDRGNEEKKIVISKLEAKVAELQAKLDSALHDTKTPAAPKADSTVEKASGNRVRVRLSGELVFTPGSARITREGRHLLSEVAKVLKESASKRIEVAGHSDSQPIGKKYEDNWQLSAERARRVVAYLHDQGVTGKHMIASGYADTDPVDPASSEEAYRKNRRVEIFIEPSE
jgi:flagellar motor protein MotB